MCQGRSVPLPLGGWGWGSPPAPPPVVRGGAGGLARRGVPPLPPVVWVGWVSDVGCRIKLDLS